MAYRVIDLFAGVGGLSYGFAHDDDFEIIAANEILEPMARAYCANHPTVKMYAKDIREFSIDDLTRDFGLRKGDVDVIVGGPPCQAYSTVGKRREDDPRGRLFTEYHRILKEVRPKLFVFENVKGLLSMQRGELIKSIVALFESIGYHVSVKLLNAADYGAPQIRERVILVGTLDGREFSFPRPTHYNPELGIPAERTASAARKESAEASDPASAIAGQTDSTGTTSQAETALKPYVTLGEALGDLPSLKTGESATSYASEPQNDYQRLMRRNAPEELAEHEVPKNSDRLVAIMEELPDGGSPKDLPEELRPASGFANCYCRLWWNRPSTTITRNLGCPSSSRCIHPKDPRPLSTREGARLQGFPDDYIFCGSRSDKHLQIGNAVPTHLSEALKDAVRAHLKGSR